MSRKANNLMVLPQYGGADKPNEAKEPSIWKQKRLSAVEPSSVGPISLREIVSQLENLDNF